ncbi:BatD protein [Tenacibaculum holothuriorum]|uniref:BatD protein n=1 Tax=Tenacibaculum holothuriorum TaxID=1635173 RepID=A0A1Y2PGG2_9FLAO|nr:BatD family protein [Tenacibaculum holothuriorum]OSY88799.1 BatD protein [Tenacibaculum holothuriorum]
MKFKLYITILFSFFSFFITAQKKTTFTTTVSKNKLGVNQRLKVDFIINKRGADNFKEPSFKNFNVVGGPSQAVSQSYVNGKFSYSKSYSFILQPKKRGELTIAPASIEIDGKTLNSNPVKVIVLKAVDIPKNPNDPNYIAQQNIHLVAEASKSSPYVGEGIYVEYRLYFSENVGIYDSSITEAPQYNGFWNQEIKQNRLQAKIGTYNGERYRYAVLHKSLLIPTKSGKLTIDPMKMDILVDVPTGRADFFGNAITRRVRKQFSSAKKIIRAQELPLANKPESFNGAVGEFDFNVDLSKNTLKANESSQIKVAVSGKGNLKLFELPKIETPKELEVYQPERKEKVTISASGLRGSVTDSYTVVPEFKGKYKIPKVSFSYFNPKTKEYKTITTEDLYVDVLQGKELNTNSDANSVVKQDVKVTGTNFRYIQNSTSFETQEKSDFFKSTPFYILLLLPLLAIPVGIFVHKKQEEKAGDVLGNKLRKADKLAKKYLSEAQKQLGNKEAFYEALERALHNYLKAKLGVETSEISREKITELLKNKNIDTTTINSFIDVLNDCDFARYTPIDNVQMNQEYEKAKQVITQIDKQL